jgi:hypothetical protein
MQAWWAVDNAVEVQKAQNYSAGLLLEKRDDDRFDAFFWGA